MDKREKVARAICAEKCAFVGEPPCYSVEGEWPNRNCSEPGCHAEAQAAIAALEPETAREDALREAAEKAGEAAVDILLRHEPEASVLKQQTTRQAAKTFILALISEDKTNG